jgi:hypothetical protein
MKALSWLVAVGAIKFYGGLASEGFSSRMDECAADKEGYNGFGKGERLWSVLSI